MLQLGNGQKKLFLIIPPVIIAAVAISSILFLTCRTADSSSAKAAIEKEPIRYSVSLLAAGDNLFHMPIIDDARNANGDYDFTSVYSEIKELVQSADIAFINQETVMAGEAAGYSGYPEFNTPNSLAKTLVETGFTIVNQANNHAMDKGGAGIISTLDTWDDFPTVSVIGIQRHKEKQHTIITKNNITLGFLAYTFSTNGIAVPKDRPWLVSMTDKKKMTEEMNALRPHCDFLIVSAHWGDEYKMQPVPSQVDLAEFFAEHNVDLVIGHHPHVLQPIAVLPRPDGKEMVCFYSLGNFVSSQRPKETLLGGIMHVKFVKEERTHLEKDALHAANDRQHGHTSSSWKLSVEEAGLIPVITHYDQGYVNTKVYPLYNYTDELLKTHHLYARDKTVTLKDFTDLVETIDSKTFSENPFLVHNDNP